MEASPAGGQNTGPEVIRDGQQTTPPPSPPATTAIMQMGPFSPLKRKRTPPADLGGSSPRAGRLARQLEELTLGKIPFTLAEEGAGDLDMETTAGPPEFQERGREEEEEGEGDEDGMAIEGREEYPGFGSALELWKEQGGGKRGARLVSPPLTVVRREGEGSDDDTMAFPEEEEEEGMDGGGLFGVGFKPTPTQSYARSQKKQQQIQDYKTRVSKEAREKRSQNRRRRRSSAAAAKEASGKEGKPDDGRGRKRVHFDV